MKVSNYPSFMNAVTINVNRNSNPYPLYDTYGLAAQAIITGTVAGTLKIQGTCDKSQLGDGSDIAANWTDIASSSQNVSNAGTLIWNLDATYYTFIRFVYTSTSGTGTLTININAKTV